MGTDKATLPWESGDLLGHAIARLRAITADVRILCGPVGRYHDRAVPVLTDAARDIGALAALLTALRALPPGGTAALLAVDLPLVSLELLAHLIALAPGFDAVVPVSSNGAEPFAAAYRASCLAPVERAVERGDFKLTGFWKEARVREVPAASLTAFGDPERLFLNVNAPEDYDRARGTKGRAR